jgi:hypothetical protein
VDSFQSSKSTGVRFVQLFLCQFLSKLVAVWIAAPSFVVYTMSMPPCQEEWNTELNVHDALTAESH